MMRHPRDRCPYPPGIGHEHEVWFVGMVHVLDMSPKALGSDVSRLQWCMSTFFDGEGRGHSSDARQAQPGLQAV